jgi:predicted glycosyltransferase
MARGGMVPYPNSSGTSFRSSRLGRKMNAQNRRLRIAFYSHDTQGLGHIRRNLALAGALAEGSDSPAILLIAGAQIANVLHHPPGVDCLTLPAVAKSAQGLYAAQHLPMTLNELLVLRAQTIAQALTTYRPDVLIVDKTPGGLMGELLPALKRLRQMGHTRCVLGLRDVLDEPIVATGEWRKARGSALVKRFYDAIWIYGDPMVYDAVREYDFLCDCASKVRFTGYLNRWEQQAVTADERSSLIEELALDVDRLAFCTVGGGQDGFDLARAFVQSELPADAGAVILTGPFMSDGDRRHLHQLAAQRARTRVLDFTPEPERLLAGADWVVSMAGYNTTCEILSAGKEALLVPRVRPRLEQWIRAQRLANLGVVTTVHPDALTPDQISRWFEWTHRRPRPRPAIDLQGLRRVPTLLQELVTTPATADPRLLQPA